jgi:hypothetical protein
MRNKSKIQSSVQVELFENDAHECNQILYIRPHYDNPEDWSEFAIQDTDPGHFDTDPKPCTKIIFDNCNLSAIIQALLIYQDNLKSINNR